MERKRKSKQKHTEPVPKKRAVGRYEDNVYFMTVALLFAEKSPDPNTKVGACIVNREGNIAGIGYNKMPNGCEDNFPWERKKGRKLDRKYMYVCHAVLNAIMNKTSVDVKGCTIYTTLFPCNECAKVIIQSGITDVVYLSNKYEAKSMTKASTKLLKAASIKFTEFPKKDDLTEFLISINTKP